MTTTTTPKPAAPPATTTTATGTQAGPMDLSAGRRRLSQAQCEDRMRRGQLLQLRESKPHGSTMFEQIKSAYS